MKEERNGVKEKLWRDYHAVPVWLSEDLADSHYNGFSSVNPPLFHTAGLLVMDADQL